jgi:hypothetical protein
MSDPADDNEPFQFAGPAGIGGKRPCFLPVITLSMEFP